MTSRLRFPPVAERRPAGPVDGVLLRLVCDDRAWAAALPDAPAGPGVRNMVSVAFSSHDARKAHSAALISKGYRMVGVEPRSCLCALGSPDCAPGHAAARGVDLADFLVRQPLPPGELTWLHELREQAVLVYQLGFGPVRAALGDTLALHLAG